ncbi:MAG: hypothetical protein RR763_06520 [Massilia sp.]
MATNTLLEDLALVATLCVPLIAIGAIAIAIWQVKENSAAVRRASAYSIYQNFLKLALDNPTIAFGDRAEILSDVKKSSVHKWFFANMLLSFEEIIAIYPNQEDWKSAIKSQLRRHAWHLSDSSSIKNKHWNASLLQLVHEAISEADNGVVGTRDAIRPSKFIFFKLYK